MRPDWKAIEADFLKTGMSYKELCNKWDVPLSTLKKHAMKGQWGDKLVMFAKAAEKIAVQPKQEPVPHTQNGMEPTVPTEEVDPETMALELRAQRQRKMIETTDAMMDRIINALELIEPENTYALLTLIKALKELREMQGLNKSALDIEEQRARIEKLKSETRTVETAGMGGVILLPDVSEELIPPND